MATAAVQLPTSVNVLPALYTGPKGGERKTHDVATTLYYYKDPGDGSPPAPTYIG